MTNDPEDIDQSDSLIAVSSSVTSNESQYNTPQSLSLNDIASEVKENLTPDTPSEDSDKIFTIGNTAEEPVDLVGAGDNQGAGDSQGSGDSTQSKPIPTNPVLGVQVDETDRVTPLFYIKPVNSEGVGLKGPDGERLDDKGNLT